MVSQHTSHSPTSLLLLVAGTLCLVHGLTKPLFWLAGERTTAVIGYQENRVTTRGAYWIRYHFSTPDGSSYSGTAMTAAKNTRSARVRVAYLPILPDLNMPAYGSYAFLLGTVWSLAGLLLILVGRLFRKKSDVTRSE